MKYALLVLVPLVACSTAGTEAPAPQQALDWLAGCWTDGRTTERWTHAGDGYLFGHNVVMADGKVRFFEQLRIEPSESGPVFQAYPRGVGPVAFVFESAGERTISFVNGSHDFPQRIGYTRNGNTLTATISLIDGSRAGGWEYRRCDE